jgi:hypothetical protein
MTRTAARERRELTKSPSFRRSLDLDTLKLYTKAHGSKTMNLIINLTNDETEILPLNTDASLASFGIGQSRSFSSPPFPPSLFPLYPRDLDCSAE